MINFVNENRVPDIGQLVTIWRTYGEPPNLNIILSETGEVDIVEFGAWRDDVGFDCVYMPVGSHGIVLDVLVNPYRVAEGLQHLKVVLLTSFGIVWTDLRYIWAEES